MRSEQFKNELGSKSRMPVCIIGMILSAGSMNPFTICQNVSRFLPTQLRRSYYNLMTANVTEKTRETRITHLTFGPIFAYLDSVSPEGCYFGGHPDDCKLIGYWKIDGAF